MANRYRGSLAVFVILVVAACFFSIFRYGFGFRNRR